jgi:hypothetical protein
MKYLREDIQSAAGSLQLCAGQEAGCEAIIHAFSKFFAGDETDAILLIDADNAFNRLNRSVALWNIKRTCPPLATFTINCYRHPSRLFVTGGGEISSTEGTTQGDPLAMPFYALSIVPFISLLKGSCKQAWYADDAQASGKLTALHEWWDKILSDGPAYGYYANPGKTKLVVKEDLLEEAQKIFKGSGISITNGSRDLGAAIGNSSFVTKYVEEKVTSWTKELEILSVIAQTSPQAAHSAFVHGMKHKWSFLQKTMPQISEKLQPLEDVIRQRFIPALLGGQQINDSMRTLMSLSGKNGGLAIENPVNVSEDKFKASSLLSNYIVESISQQDHILNYRKEKQNEIRNTNRAIKLTKEKVLVEDLKNILHPDQVRCMITAQEKGASALITTLPIKRHDFSLSKSEFTDALLMRYRLPLTGLPSTCICGQSFSVDHSQCCHVGGFVNMRHDNVRDILANSMREVLRDVETEPRLKPLSGEVFVSPSTITDSDARSDIRARGFWTNQQEAFFDVRIFYPNATSYLTRNISSLYQSFENQKKSVYNERILNVDRGTFTPMIFSSSGGMGLEAKKVIKKVASMLAEKEKSAIATH